MVARSARARSTSAKKAARVGVSRPAAGSSRSSASGIQARARTRLTRWASPPDRLCWPGGRRGARRPGASARRWRLLWRVASGGAAIAKRQLDVVADGRGEQDGALGRVGEPAAKGRAALLCGGCRRRGSRRRSVRRWPASRRSRLVLPAPLRPSSPSRSPAATPNRSRRRTSRPPQRWRTRRRQDRAHAAPRCCTEVSTALTAKASASSTAP